jgi:cytosine/adenosine deaminase-related metal-dependent hydrolase
MADPFDSAYLAGAPKQLDPVHREIKLGFAPAEVVALTGCVLTADPAPLDPGCVVIENGAITAVTATPPAGAKVVDTQGVIAPGLLDLHGHPEFNVFAAWEPPKTFANRYAWRDSKIYKQLVRTPQNDVLSKLPAWTQLRYAEVRALVGGVTAIQGSGEAATAYQAEALVRNVDKWIFGGQVGRALVDLPSGNFGLEGFTSVMKGIDAGKVKAFYIHLAEGSPDDDRSKGELDALVKLGGLRPQTVIIHGTALDEAQLGTVHDAGAKLVWSPQSNLRLYGETTQAAKALELGIPVALGADWLPSGSTSLLAEIKVARRVLAEQSGGADPGAQRLVRMVTSDAAAIAGLDDKLGTLAPGRPADIAVFERSNRDDPWECVAGADPSLVQLVMIGGDVAYGHAPLVQELIEADELNHFEALTAWGKRMLLDTGYEAHAKAGETPPPRLSELRTELVNVYPQLGPIFA